MPPYRDLGAYDDRAVQYDRGWRGRLHHTISERTAALATSTVTSPRRVLDVGCGTGYLLRSLANRYPGADELAGIDAAPNMIETARRLADDNRLTFSSGVAERLPYPGGHLVLVDQFSVLLMPTIAVSRRGKARTRGRANRLLLRAGFDSPHWHRLHAVIINAAVAKRS